jgi:hypothetical protein
MLCHMLFQRPWHNRGALAQVEMWYALIHVFQLKIHAAVAAAVAHQVRPFSITTLCKLGLTYFSQDTSATQVVAARAERPAVALSADV